MKFRDATGEDFRDFYGRSSPVTFKGRVAEKNGVVIGIGGYYPVGTCVYAFTDQRGMNKREMVLAAREFMRMLGKINRDVIAKCFGPDTMLRHFGFEPFGEYYRLKKCPA